MVMLLPLTLLKSIKSSRKSKLLFLTATKRFKLNCSKLPNGSTPSSEVWMSPRNLTPLPLLLLLLKNLLKLSPSPPNLPRSLTSLKTSSTISSLRFKLLISLTQRAISPSKLTNKLLNTLSTLLKKNSFVSLSTTEKTEEKSCTPIRRNTWS